LNDEVISAYMTVLSIKKAVKNQTSGTHCQSFNFGSFFYSHLMGENGTKRKRYNYRKVKNVTRKIVPQGNIFLLERLFIPINQVGNIGYW
jgi:Ulp1 family protease